MLRESGALEVHVRISSPPVKWPCFYGIDFASRAELIANGLDVEGVRRSIGADSLGYVSLEGLVGASEQPASRLCTACFDGDYPIPLPAPELVGKHVLEGIERSVTPARPARPGTRSRSSGSSTRPRADRRGDHPGEIERTPDAGMAGPAARRPRHAGLGGRRGRPRHRSGPRRRHPLRLAVTRSGPSVAGLPQRVSGARRRPVVVGVVLSSSSTSSSIRMEDSWPARHSARAARQSGRCRACCTSTHGPPSAA